MDKFKDRWIEGKVSPDSVDTVIGPDGAKYKVKPHHQQYLESDMAVRFVAGAKGDWKRWAIRCVPVAMWPKGVQFIPNTQEAA